MADAPLPEPKPLPDPGLFPILCIVCKHRLGLHRSSDDACPNGPVPQVQGWHDSNRYQSPD